MGPFVALLVEFLIQVAIAVAATVIIAKLFPTKIFGPKLNDLRIQTSTYGNAIPLLLGQTVRVAGNVIWSSGLIERIHEEGGGSGPPEVTTYTYSTNVAVALGERPNGIAGVLQILGNGKLIYDGTLTEDNGTAVFQGEIPFYADTVIQATLAAMGFPLSAAAAVSTLPLLQEAFRTHGIFTRITVYPGNFTQEPDPLLEAALGIGNVPAYRGTAYVVLEGLQLGDFGNMLPNLEFIVIPNPDETYGSAIATMIERAGIDEDKYNVCNHTPLLGYPIGREITASEALAPLTFAGNLDIVDDAGNLRAITRDDSAIAIISTDDLGGHSFGEERPDPVKWEREAVVSLPREFAVTFADPARLFQANSIVARRATGTANANIAVELPLTLTADMARALADRGLWESWHANTSAVIMTTDRLINMKVGRVYLIETPAGFEAFRVFSKTRGKNGVIEWELRRERTEIYSSPNTGTSGTFTPGEIAIPGPTEIILLDIPILRDGDDDAGFYFVVVGSETGWRGSAAMRALSLSEDFVTMEAMGVQAVVGDVLNTLAEGPTELDGSGGTFDDVNYIDVELRHGGMTLSSVSDEAIDAGANGCFVGSGADTTQGEILQFGIATLLSGDIYRLTHLKRGRRGTEFAVTLHGSAETFVLLKNDGSLIRKDFGTPDLELERAYKAVSLLLSADDVDAVLFTNTGVGLRPYSPIDLDVSGDTGGDLILSWTRRSRLDSGALGEDAEVYCLRIMDAGGTTVEREVHPTDREFTYTGAMQTADFGGAIADLNWRVAEVSATYGNGIFATWSGPIPVSGSGGAGSSRFQTGYSTDGAGEKLIPFPG